MKWILVVDCLIDISKIECIRKIMTNNKYCISFQRNIKECFILQFETEEQWTYEFNRISKEICEMAHTHKDY